MKQYYSLSKYIFLAFVILFIHCSKEETITKDSTTNVPSNPSDAVELFKMEDVPEIKLTVPLKDWNTLLTNFDLNPANDEKVVSHFEFKLNGQKYTLDSIALRLRGNTSRRRPEGSTGNLHNPLAPNWNHCHFGLDFSKFKKKQRFAKREKINLKWFKDDANYVREIYSYDLFERFGVWAAPQASYCRLTIYVEGDATPAYYGVYAMIESIDEDYIANRSVQWGGNVGYLWKCGNMGGFKADFVQNTNIGVQDIQLDPSLSKVYSYDLKTRESEILTAQAELTSFISDLNNKTNTEFKSWISSKMDVPLFLKTYAVNVALGMWDDYWINGNNFYFYFAGNGKAYFIPYDYDNTLGTSLFVNSGTQDPVNWGKNNGKPLLNRILAVPEYKEIYKSYLKELIDPSADLFDATKSMNRISGWKIKIEPYVSNDTGKDMFIEDKPAYWGNAPFYRLNSGNSEGGNNGDANYFKTKAKSINW